MKKMTTLVAAAFTAAAIFLGSTANAQTSTSSEDSRGWRFGLGVEALAPTGALHDFSSFGLGGTARLQYDVKSSLSFTLTSGYYNFFAKKQAGIEVPDQGIVPVKLGVKAFFAPKWYFGAEAGAGFETKYGKNTKLILSPGIGFSGDSGWDVGVRYENFSGQSNNYGAVGLRVAYAFL
nr:hypothetical protein [uncultured Mucilaginibacter sp.]